MSRNFLNALNLRKKSNSRASKANSRSRWRPTFELLEDRVTPSSAGFTSTALGVVSGFVFVDANGNGVRDSGELPMPGVGVTLTGKTSLGADVTVSTTTNGNGQFTFFQVSPGTYSLVRGQASNFIDGQVANGSLGGVVGMDQVSTIGVSEGQTAINYDFSVRGLTSGNLSLRDFLASTTIVSETSQFLPAAAGVGQTAADGTVQPSAAAVAGTGSLSGTVVNAANAGIQGVQVALTGLDSTGRAIFETTVTDAAGGYQFTELQGGTYNLNITTPPAGLRDGDTAVGTAGGQVFQTGQVVDIQLNAGVSADGYKFTELQLPTLLSGTGIAMVAGLAHDTAGPGGTTSDGITADPSTVGQVVSSSPLASLEAGLDGAPASSFLNLLGNVASGGVFFLNPAMLALIAGGALTQGSHTLHLVATNSQGQTASASVHFTLQSAAPTTPTLHMDTTADPGQTGITTQSTANLQGHTAPGVSVSLFKNGALLAGTTADATTGNFAFNNVALAAGSTDFTVQATDVAGNISQFQTFFVHQVGPVAVATSPITEALTTSGANKLIDLSSSTLFTDAASSNTLLRFNTNDGPINVELFDTQAPQTVANFLDYVKQGDFTNDIFHRLATNFVLQAGGFTYNPSTHTVTTLTAGPSIQSEFSATRSNTQGTLAMALVGSNANSGTDEFYFNLVNNASSLDPQNFTVFGKVLSGADMRVINTLASATVKDESSFNSSFNTLPTNNYTGTNFPTDTTAANFDIISSVDIVQQTEQLTYSVLSNTNGLVVTPTIDNFGQLLLQPGATGSSTVVVKATDKGGDSATVTFTVNVT
jgi:cyclophilin family peptidyl-prolyl cis-trans isomerase